MSKKAITYLGLISIHIVLGFFTYLFSKLAIPYGLAILSIGILTLLKTHNNNNQVLYICGYIIGSEVLLRMTGGFILYEIAKYSIIIFMLLSIYFSGFLKSSYLFWFFLILLIPGILIASANLNLDTSVRKAIAFNLSGPVCIGIASLYACQRPITLKEIENILLAILLPIITTVTYMYFYTPSVRDLVKDTNSNFATSGGFGPNQVSTILGLGIFILFARLIFNSKDTKTKLVNLFLLFMVSYRGVITFSRGGVYTALIMIAFFTFILFRNVKRSSKIKILLLTFFSCIAVAVIWFYSSFQTNGLIDKRYANQDAAGRIKSSQLSGREMIMEDEFNLFLQNPIMGIGVGKSKESRYDENGDPIASHNEITRMLAEHGVFGVFALLILAITPLALYINNKMHIYLLPFYFFWLLTINHAAMRLAAPAFVYALTLLHVYGIEKSKKNDSTE